VRFYARVAVVLASRRLPVPGLFAVGPAHQVHGASVVSARACLRYGRDAAKQAVASVFGQVVPPRMKYAYTLTRRSRAATVFESAEKNVRAPFHSEVVLVVPDEQAKVMPRVAGHLPS